MPYSFNCCGLFNIRRPSLKNHNSPLIATDNRKPRHYQKKIIECFNQDLTEDLLASFQSLTEVTHQSKMTDLNRISVLQEKKRTCSITSVEQLDKTLSTVYKGLGQGDKNNIQLTLSQTFTKALPQHIVAMKIKPCTYHHDKVIFTISLSHVTQHDIFSNNPVKITLDCIITLQETSSLTLQVIDTSTNQTLREFHTQASTGYRSLSGLAKYRP